MRSASGVLIFITGLALLVFAASSPAAATGGSNNDPPGFCIFHIHGFSFDSSSSGWWRIERWAPTGSGTVMQEAWGPADSEGDWKSRVIELPGGHYQLFWDQTTPPAPGGEKHKVFWVECEEQGTTTGTTTTSTTGGTTGVTTGTTTGASLEVETLRGTSGGPMRLGGAVAGFQTVPSTSRDSGDGPTIPFAFLGIALMASGAVMLIRHKPQKPFTP